MSTRARPPSASPVPEGAGVPVRHRLAPAPGTVLGPHYAGCFGCGPQVAGGLRLQVRAGDGVQVTAMLEILPTHQGAPGLAHGGVLAAAFDESMGYLLHLMRRPAVTVHLETDYAVPVPLGEIVRIDARCTGVDGRKIYTHAEARTAGGAGVLAATATAVFVEVPLEHFRAHAGATMEPSLEEAVGP